MSAIIRISCEMKRYFLNSNYERGGETPQTEVNPICQTKTYFATDVEGGKRNGFETQDPIAR